MKHVPKTHWVYMGAETPACSEPSRNAKLTHDQAAVTCGRCLKLLGVTPDVQTVHRLIERGFLASFKPATGKPKADVLVIASHSDKIDSLLRRAFVDSEAMLDDLCTKAKAMIADYDAHPNDPPAENMADLLRGFLKALGRAD